MNLDTSKYLGGIGAILLLIGFLVPRISPPASGLSLIGLILLLIGLKGLADYYKNSGIFYDFLYGLVAGIIGVIAAVTAAFYLILPTVLTTIYPGWTFGDWSALSTMTAQTPTTPDQIASFAASIVRSTAGGIVAVLVILLVFFVIAALLMRRSLNMLSQKAGQGLFATTGTLLLIGAILTIVGIGYIIIWISIIFLAIAFLTLKPLPTPADTGAPAQPPTSV